jgi:hypothetical protein
MGTNKKDKLRIIRSWHLTLLFECKNKFKHYNIY